MRVHVQFSTNPYQPLFWGGERNHQLCQIVLYTTPTTCAKVRSTTVVRIKSKLWGGGQYTCFHEI